MDRLMATEQTSLSPHRRILALASAPLLCMLLGCPNDVASAAAPGRSPASATAPATQPTAADQQAIAQKASADQAAAQHAQKVQALINKAEAAYKSGVDNYNANRLDAARLDFDFAVDTMLSSGMDLKEDQPLADEFERLVSAINSLEMVALKQGNGFSPPLEAAPVDAADEVTFAPNPVLVEKVAAELKTTTSDMPLVINDYVAGWISAFTNKPVLHAHLKRSIERAGKYKDMIERVLREQGVPQDLIYQAVTESGFQPQVLNRTSGAGGMWQFMPFGDYGLERNAYFDERFDPEKSTIAYAKYMKKLYGMFGDWYLAMAAYDWGPGRVQHVVSRTGYADYWDIYRHGGLPAETKAYIPSVIAAIIMAKNPEQYGLTNLNLDAPVLSDKVTTTYAIDLRLVADVTDSTVADIVAINPALLRLSTPRDIPYDLHIPSGSTAVYNERLKDIPEDKRNSWRFHVVKPGETLEGIATSLHAKPAEIATLNEITAAKPMQPDDELVIPVAAASAPLGGQQRYTARRGDTLVTVSDRFGISVEELRKWNGLRTSVLTPGKSLFVAEPIRLAPGTHATRGRHGKGKAGKTTTTRSSTTRNSPHSTKGRSGAASAMPSAKSRKPSTAKPAAKSSAKKPAKKSAH